MIRQDLRTYLKTKTGLTDLIGGATDPRLYLAHVPEANPPLSLFPCVVYLRATGGYGHDIDGSDGTAAPTFEFYTLGTDPEEVEEISEQLRQALQGGPTTMGSTEMLHVTLEDESDDYLETKVGEDTLGLHETVQRFVLAHKVTKPTF